MNRAVSPCSAEALARRWVPGRGAVEVRALGSGSVNRSYRVSRDGQSYLLRVAAPDGMTLQLDRVWECAVVRAAAHRGLAPRVHCCHCEEGILVTDWLEGRTWTRAQLGTDEGMAAMARLLHAVHALPLPDAPRRMTPAGWIGSYSTALEHHVSGAAAPRLEALRGKAQIRLAEVAAFDARHAPMAVLCHGDLHRFNVLVGEAVRLLDWEYAHVSDAMWDLAGWSANNDWTVACDHRWLAAYFGRPPTLEESARLRAFAWLYDYVCLLWSDLYLALRGAVTAQEGMPAAAWRAVNERTMLLFARLTAG